MFNSQPINNVKNKIKLFRFAVGVFVLNQVIMLKPTHPIQKKVTTK